MVVRIRGGLLGHWSVWTKTAVELLAILHLVVGRGAIPLELLELDARVTDANAAFFDVAHDFAGCIAGCHEVLRRLRERVELAGVPAYMCSADAMPEDLARAREAGFDGYWTKPIELGVVSAELAAGDAARGGGEGASGPDGRGRHP